MLNIGFGITASGYKVPSGGGGSYNLTYQGTGTNSADLATYTYASQAIGTAGATRRVIVGVGWRGISGTTTAISSVTIGGITATQDASGTQAGNAAAIFSAVVPTGTTATVVVDFGGNAQGRCAIGVWTIDTGSLAAGSSDITNPISMTVATTVGDPVIAVACENGTSATFTWSANVTERFDFIIEGTAPSFSGADMLAVGTSTVVTVTQSSGTTPRGAIAAYH